MVFSRQASSPRRSYNNQNDGNRLGRFNERSFSSRPVANSGGSLSSRFGSMAAERISTRSEPSRPRPRARFESSVSKPFSAGRHHRRRDDRGMEVDQIGSSSLNRGSSSGPRRGNSRSHNQSRNGGVSGRDGRNRNSSRINKSVKKGDINQSDLDKELDAYMMKNESTARTTLDMDLDSYMSAAPSKAI